MTDLDQPSGENHKQPEDPQQPSRRFPWPRNKTGRFWIGLSAVAVIGLAAGLVAVGVGGTPSASSGSSAGPRVAAGVTGPTSGGMAANGTGNANGGAQRSANGDAVSNGTGEAKGNVISAAKLAEQGGALGLPKNMQSQVMGWQSGPGGTHLAAVSSGLGNALQAGGIRQYAPMKHACAQLAATVATAKAGPQIPDSAMQGLYAKALAELARGASNCQTAISINPDGDESVDARVNTTMLHLSISELSVGATDLFRSTAEIEIVARQHR